LSFFKVQEGKTVNIQAIELLLIYMIGTSKSYLNHTKKVNEAELGKYQEILTNR